MADTDIPLDITAELVQIALTALSMVQDITQNTQALHEARDSETMQMCGGYIVNASVAIKNARNLMNASLALREN